MERPIKCTMELSTPLFDGGISMKKSTLEYYKCTDIDPLLDELEMYRNTVQLTHLGNDNVQIRTAIIEVDEDISPFPSLEEFTEWYYSNSIDCKNIYEYFSQFQYERTVFPEVGDIVEGNNDYTESEKGILTGFMIQVGDGKTLPFSEIRPVSRPTREEVVAKVESKLDNDELTFDRELVEQFLRILRGE